jgi:hypothetical protein
MLLLALLCTTVDARVPDADALTRLLLSSQAKAQLELIRAPELYPHTFVYGVEAEAKVGIGDVIEKGASLKLELHYQRVTP